MTKVFIYKNENNECVGFKAFGHAGYAEEGEDIVCAAISVLTINTINSIEALTTTKASLDTNQRDGSIEYKILGKPSKESTLLLDAMTLGLKMMAEDENYSEYIDLKFREV